MIVVEGEPARDALAPLAKELDIAVVATVTGAGKGQAPGLRALGPLHRANHVVLWPDNDEAGQAHMALTARRLATIGHPSVQVITWPDAPEKGDGADFINGGGTAEGVRALIDSAAPFDGGVDAGGLVVVEAVDVEPRAVRWLWLSRVPMGGITMLDGDPGEGKTAIALKFSSLVSQGGLFPDDPTKREPRKVLYISVEDDPAFTLVPRLKSMGANLSNVAFLVLMRDPKGEERVLDITRDLPELEAEVARRNPALIVIDPVQAHIGAGTDMNRVNQVRAAMAPVALLAAKYDCAILIVRHFNKQGGTKALYRGMGQHRLLRCRASRPGRGDGRGRAPVAHPGQVQSRDPAPFRPVRAGRRAVLALGRNRRRACRRRTKRGRFGRELAGAGADRRGAADGLRRPQARWPGRRLHDREADPRGGGRERGVDPALTAKARPARGRHPRENRVLSAPRGRRPCS